MKKKHFVKLISVFTIVFLLLTGLPVLADTVIATSVSISKATDVLTVGQSDTLTATVLPSNATNQNLTWISANPTIAKVFNGVVMALSTGTTYITVYNTDGKTATCLVIVKNPASTLTLNKSTDTMTVGSTDTLTATVTPSQTVNWLSSDSNIVQVFNGVLMALSAGTAVITATAADGSGSATCTVTVNNASSTVTLNKSTDIMAVGSTDTLTATVTPNQSVNWSSSDNSIVQVFNGALMALNTGTAVITATAADGSGSAACTVTVNNASSTVTLNKTNDTIPIGGTDTLTATVSPALPLSVYIMWVSSNPSVVSVSGGVISGLSAGSAVITAIASDGSTSATCNVMVTENGKNSVRLGGADRYATSVAISQSGWPNGSAYAVLATGNDYPDALSAAPLAKKYNAPILLTDTVSLPQNILNEIERLKAAHIFICGGTGVVSQNIENQLNSLGITTERLYGNDRYGTSLAIAQKVGATSGALFAANGYDWADALSASSIAAKMGVPIILTDRDVFSDPLNSFMAARNFNKTYILGSTDLISDAVANKFPGPERITGSTEYERNINILTKFQSNLDLSNICVATGTDFPDALSGSALAATLSSAIVLVDNNGLANVTTQYAAQNLSQTSNIYVFGLQGAVSDDLLNQLFGK